MGRTTSRTPNRSMYDDSVIPDTNKRVEDGLVYEIAYDWPVIAAGGTAYGMVRTADRILEIITREIKTDSTDLEYVVLSGPDVTTEGTPIFARSRNPNMPNVNDTMGYINPTGVSGGLALYPVWVPGSGSGNNSASQFSVDGYPRMLEPNKDYVLQVVNNGAQACRAQVYVMFASHDPTYVKQSLK